MYSMNHLFHICLMKAGYNFRERTTTQTILSLDTHNLILKKKKKTCRLFLGKGTVIRKQKELGRYTYPL